MEKSWADLVDDRFILHQLFSCDDDVRVFSIYLWQLILVI